MTRPLFDRVIALTIIRPQVGGSGFFAETANLDNGLEIRNLRMRFEIEKKIDKDPNTCTVTVTNLNEATRAEVLGKNLIARLTAGYQGTEELLYIGNIRSAPSRIQGADWETTIKIADGGRAFAAARVSQAFTSGTPIRAIVEAAAHSMGLVLPDPAGLVEVLGQKIPIGESMDEPARDLLTRFLLPWGYGWSIQNGKLQILRSDQAREGEAYVVSQETGLIGSPQYDTPDKGKNNGKTTLSFETLLYPQLVPGAKVDLRSRAANGIHKIKSVKHVGDTAGGDWKSTVDAIPVPGEKATK